MVYFYTFVVAMFITIVLIPPLMSSAWRFAFLDQPGGRKIHDQPIPRVGGIAMVAGCVIPILMWADISDTVMALLLGIGVIVVFGVLDDRFALDYRIKFIGQLLAVCIAVFYGGVRIDYVPFHGVEPIAANVAVPLTLFALLGVTNAINLADGLDGLAGGTSLLSFALVGLLAYLAGDGNLTLLTLAVGGCIVGFLRFNTYPAQTFMGDGGSQFLGYMLGVLVIMLTQQTNAALSPAMALLLLGFPLLDTFLVMGQRILEKRSPFSPDKNHIHHTLLALGFDHYEAVVMIYSLQAALVSCAFAFRYSSDLLVMGIFVGLFVATIVLFRVVPATGWKVHARHIDDKSALARVVRRLKASGVLTRYPVAFIAVSLPVYLGATLIRAGHLPLDAMYTAAVLLVLAVGIGLRRRTAPVTLLERALVYVTITLVVYYGLRGGGAEPAWPLAENLYFTLLLLAIVTVFRFVQPRSFAVTPLDFLVVIMAALVPNLLAPRLPIANLGEIVLKIFVLFYASELLLTQLRGKTHLIRGALVGILALLVAKAV